MGQDSDRPSLIFRPGVLPGEQGPGEEEHDELAESLSELQAIMGEDAEERGRAGTPPPPPLPRVASGLSPLLMDDDTEPNRPQRTGTPLKTPTPWWAEPWFVATVVGSLVLLSGVVLALLLTRAPSRVGPDASAGEGREASGQPPQATLGGAAREGATRDAGILDAAAKQKPNATRPKPAARPKRRVGRRPRRRKPRPRKRRHERVTSPKTLEEIDELLKGL